MSVVQPHNAAPLTGPFTNTFAIATPSSAMTAPRCTINWKPIAIRCHRVHQEGRFFHDDRLFPGSSAIGLLRPASQSPCLGHSGVKRLIKVRCLPRKYIWTPSRGGLPKRKIEPWLPSVPPDRFFQSIRYAAGTWKTQRRVIAKIEHTDQGANPRFIGTNLKGPSQ